MGTLADFYVKNGDTYEWLGSIEWDGFPDEMPSQMMEANTEQDYRNSVSSFLKDRDDAFTPKDGWLHPWENSNTTDYAYIFNTSDVTTYISNFGGPLYTIYEEKAYKAYCQQCDEDDEDPMDFDKYIKELGFNEEPVFPNMKNEDQ